MDVHFNLSLGRMARALLALAGIALLLVGICFPTLSENKILRSNILIETC